MDRPIFHLSLPVLDLPVALAFYRRALGAAIGRENAAWADILVFGHQLTLHHRPDEVLPRDNAGVRHFGAILPWREWEALGARLAHLGCPLLQPPTVFGAGTAQEHGKMALADPSGNVIEIKAYRDVATVLGIRDVPG